jgi:prephenate dehydratase
MRQFAKPALALVDSMRAAAAADPARAIAFGGAPGSNSHQAAMQFAPEALPLPCFSFEDALAAVESGAAGCAMIPIENSQHGRVADIHFLLPASGLSIVAEHFMRITHCLMALGPGPFEAAYSHPQALGQSHRFLGERGIVGLSHADTAGAAAFVAESGKPDIAAIAPALAADLYGLEIIEREVEDVPDNTTRFVVLAKATRKGRASRQRSSSPISRARRGMPAWTWRWRSWPSRPMAYGCSAATRKPAAAADRIGTAQRRRPGALAYSSS